MGFLGYRFRFYSARADGVKGLVSEGVAIRVVISVYDSVFRDAGIYIESFSEKYTKLLPVMFRGR